jgi:LytR cell envelope-related transcriptional attenuator
VNTGTIRIAIVVALLAVGALVLTNGFADTGSAAIGSPAGGSAPSTSDSPSPTGTGTPPAVVETPAPAAPKDTSVAVFNGTDSVGLAGIVMEDLTTADGYVEGQPPADAPTKGVEKTIVYFVGGADAAQNESNATALADAHFKGAKVKELSTDLGDVVDKGVQVVVVVGLNDVPSGG